MELKLDFKFDAAHRLMHHKGACQCLHGHTWKVRITLEGAVDLLSGMITDFKDLKHSINAILHLYDHTTILNAEDELVKTALRNISMPFAVTNGEPSCENIVKGLWTRLGLMFTTTPKLVEVQVWESDTASAVYRGEK